jgi:hypothetical protein
MKKLTPKTTKKASAFSVAPSPTDEEDSAAINVSENSESLSSVFVV